MNASISTNQTSSIRLSNSSSSLDFELADAAAKISSASIRVISLSSQSSRAGVDIATGVTIPGVSAGLDVTQNIIRQYMSALELDYSDDLNAELSNKRIINRLYELQGLINGIENATEIVNELGDALVNVMQDKFRSYYASSKAPSGPGREGDFIYEVLRAIQERFGLYDPNNPTDTSDTFDPAMNPRLALTEALQVQIGSGEGFSPAPSSSALLGPARSATPVIEDPAQQAARAISSREAVVREIGRDAETEIERLNREAKEKEREKERSRNNSGKGSGG